MSNLLITDKTIEPGEVIKNLRSKRGITLEQLADFANLSTSGISRWENGDRSPNVKAFIDVVNALGADVVIVKRRDVAESDPASEEVK